jgi:CubicO group peptidase (beta-lactamase class C family)
MNSRLFIPSLLFASLLGVSAKQPALEVRRPSVIAPVMQRFVDDHTIAGAVTLIASGDKVLSLEATGSADLKTKKEMKTDSMFWIASMTKPMTAMAVMMLVEEGKLKIEDPVEKYLPEFKGQMLTKEKDKEKGILLVKPARPVTVKDLLTHSSGLISKSPLQQSQLDTLTLKESVITYAMSPLQFDPGSKWSYCNPGISTLGRIIEVVSGKPYADFMQERLFTPLGMKDTTFWPTEEQEMRIAKSYKMNADKSGLDETPISFLSQPLTNRKRMPLPAGGLFSCAPDLVRIYQMALNGGTLNGKRFLKEETLKQMTSNQLGDMKVSFTEGMNMGLGFHFVKTPMGVTESLSAGSFGHGGAYGTQSWIDPQRKLIMVLLIQRTDLGNSDGSALRAAFQKAAVAVFGK